VNPAAPLEIACRDPHTIGRDRLFAAAGAWAELHEAGIVLDAGTALTVDALDSGKHGGRFLGGAIAPGPQLLARALGTGAAQLFEVDYAPNAPALGRDSAAALRAGISVGFRGAAIELVRCVAREAGLEDSVLWLTGGASEALALPHLFEGFRLRHEPRLVHLGLLAALGERPGA
jgi:type III pantothenate kinase